MATTTTPIKTATGLRIHADCPYCELSGEVATDGWYDNQWDGGRGGYRVTCPSCDKPFVVTQTIVNDLQQTALVLLGEDENPPPPVERLDDEEICEQVAALLTAAGFPAEAQYTGGGIWCVSIAEPTRTNASWLCGMSCEDWAGTLMEADSYAPYEGDDDDEDMQLLDCPGVSSESQDVAAIAAALGDAIRAWRATKGGE
jgi:hypothetical protein